MQSLMGGSGQSSEDRNANGKVGAYRIPVMSKDFFDGWARIHVCYTLAEHLPTFCPCPETFQRMSLRRVI